MFNIDLNIDRISELDQFTLHNLDSMLSELDQCANSYDLADLARNYGFGAWFEFGSQFAVLTHEGQAIGIIRRK